MHAMNHNWSARKHGLRLQSAAGISRHSALSEDRIRQCGTSSGSRCKDTDQCLQVTISFYRQHSVPCKNGSVKTTLCRGRSKPGCQIMGSHAVMPLNLSIHLELPACVCITDSDSDSNAALSEWLSSIGIDDDYVTDRVCPA